MKRFSTHSIWPPIKRNLLQRITLSLFAIASLSALFATPQVTFAQRPSYSFLAKISADSILIGDQVELSIQASLPEGYSIQFPTFSDTIITGIEVLGLPIIDTLINKSGEKEYTYRLKLTSFDVGYYRVPPFRLPYSVGEVRDTAQTAPIWFLVNTLEPDSTVTTIHDIKMPLAEPITFAEIAPWVGGGLALALLITLLVYYIIKRKKGEPVFFNLKPAEPAYVIALRELGKIKDKKLWDTNNHKHYQSFLTDIIRNYIQGQFNISAMEQTTDETICSLKKGKYFGQKLLNDLEETLSLADLVKFAKFTPSVSENEAGLNFGFRFVNETKIEVVEDDNNDVSIPVIESLERNDKSNALPVEPIKTIEE